MKAWGRLWHQVSNAHAFERACLRTRIQRVMLHRIHDSLTPLLRCVYWLLRSAGRYAYIGLCDGTFLCHSHFATKGLE